VTTGWTIKESGFDVGQGKEFVFLFPRASRPTLESTYAFLSMVTIGFSFGHEVDRA
jgi:hypothetical protein